jgi:hypothetical protein
VRDAGYFALGYLGSRNSCYGPRRISRGVSEKENLAKKEDLDDLLREVHAVTTTTKKIEAEISSGVWDKQKRWELKPEVLFEAARRVAAAFDALKNLDNILQKCFVSATLPLRLAGKNLQ